MSFSDDILKFAKKTNSNIEEVMQATSISMFSAIVLRTLVKTGRARGNWLYTTESPATGTLETGPDKSEADTGSSSKIAGMIQKGHTHILTNNLPYIEPMENGDTNRAPVGMVKTSVTEFRAQLKKAVRKVK